MFWRQSRQDVERLIKQNLARYLPVRQREIALGPEHIEALEKTLEVLKKLPEAPTRPVLPFSIAPKGAYKRALLRPGKVYIEAREKEDFQRLFNKLPFLAKLEPWQGYYELKIPSTVDPELLFRYRDLLLVGPFKGCLRCALPWHPTTSCPGKRQKVPGKDLQAFLHQPLESLARELNQAFYNWPKKGTEWNRKLAERYYYLQPGFLRQLFQTSARKWEEFRPFKEKLSGGKIFLALEAIQFGQYKEAKRYLEEVFEQRKDWRALVALAHLALERGDVVEGLYYVESALTQVDTPLLEAYLLFLKGWFFELKKDFFKAEEAYNQALRRDRTCFPAQFHLCLFMTRYHLWDDVFQRLPLVCQDSRGLFLVFIEPRFWPIAAQVEELVVKVFKERQAQAASRLAAAENNLRPVIKLLPEKQAQELDQRLQELRKKIYEGGYEDFIEAEKQGLSLSLEAQGLLYRQVQEARKQFKRFQEKLQSLEAFWRTKGEKDPEFRALLDQFREKLDEIETALGQNPTGNLRSCARKLEELEKRVEQINLAQQELLARLRFKHQLYSFIRTFLALETLLFLIFLIYPRLASFLFPRSTLPLFSPETFFAASFICLVLAIFRAVTKKF